VEQYKLYGESDEKLDAFWNKLFTGDDILNQLQDNENLNQKNKTQRNNNNSNESDNSGHNVKKRND